MENQIKILNLLNQKRQYVTLLNELVYGAIEIREKDSKNISICIQKRMAYNPQNMWVNTQRNYII